MATRWEVTKAVRASTLPAPSRLVMLVLADVAEVGTAEIPAKFTPSLRVLAEETGLDRSTIKRHLALLEEVGWIVRTRPDSKAQWQGERNRYRLDLPRGVEPLGAEDTHPGGTEHPGVGAENHMGGRAVRLLETDHPDQDLISSDRPSLATDLAIVERPDVEQICRHLADRIEANGSKRPGVGKRWRDAARLLIDADGRTVDQVIRAIDWCQDDDFWRSNVLSMPKLREKYDQLRLAAQRSRAPTTNGSTNRDMLQRAMERAQAKEASGT